MSKEKECNQKRSELDETIKVNVVKNIDWNQFKYLVDIPVSFGGKKGTLDPCDRLKFETRLRGRYDHVAV